MFWKTHEMWRSSTFRGINWQTSKFSGEKLGKNGFSITKAIYDQFLLKKSHSWYILMFWSQRSKFQRQHETLNIIFAQLKLIQRAMPWKLDQGDVAQEG